MTCWELASVDLGLTLLCDFSCLVLESDLDGGRLVPGLDCSGVVPLIDGGLLMPVSLSVVINSTVKGRSILFESPEEEMGPGGVVDLDSLLL